MVAKSLNLNPFHYCCFTLIFFLTSSCHVARYVYWNFADINDFRKFDADTIKPSDKPYTFKGLTRSVSIPLQAGFDVKAESHELESFLAVHKTVAFLVIRRDSLIFEHYFDGYTRESVLPSFSLSKSFVSALIGIAIGEKIIGSLDQPVTDFLPEMADSGFRNVTLRNLLEMRSGINFNEGYNSPFGEMAKFYYGLNLKKYTMNLRTAGNPGEEYSYQSANTEILALILERATGKPLYQYMEEKLWKPMGANKEASWSVDSKKYNEVKAFCCLNATALDFAKFGQLYLDHGIFDGDTVVPPEWVRESLTIRNNSRDSQGFPYTYHWRVTDEGDFFAKGILGQYIYVSPEKKIVIVRFGKKSTDLVWARFFRELINEL